MGFIIAILILLLIIIFSWNVSAKDGDSRAISCFCAIIFSTMVTGVFIIYKNKDNPTALDVYKGKTTLEITYRDSIPIDTIVVFKKDITNLNIY